MDGVTHWPVYLCESSILITKACVCNFTDLESNRGARNTHETLSGMSELYELVINQSELNAVLADRGRSDRQMQNYENTNKKLDFASRV